MNAKSGKKVKELNPLIQGLVDKFGVQEVFYADKPIKKLSQQDVEDIYWLLNLVLFDNNLKMPKIEESRECVEKNYHAAYCFRKILLKTSDGFGLVKKTTKLPNGKVIGPPRIIISPLMLSNVNLMFFVNMLAHEMIHQDDVENGTYLKRLYKAKKEGKDIDPHDGYFMQMATAFNKEFGLNIQKTGNYKTGGVTSVIALRKSLLEQEHKKFASVEEDDDLEQTNRNVIKNCIASSGEDVESTYLGNGAFDIVLQ